MENIKRKSGVEKARLKRAAPLLQAPDDRKQLKLFNFSTSPTVS